MILAATATMTTLKPLARFPAIRRDLSLIVAEQLPYEKVDTLIRSLKIPMLEDHEYVTTYRSKPVEKGQKSVTVTLIFRSLDGTLTADQVEPAVQQIVQAAQLQLGATLRT